jgi:serine/threonine protein kinase
VQLETYPVVTATSTNAALKEHHHSHYAARLTTSPASWLGVSRRAVRGHERHRRWQLWKRHTGTCSNSGISHCTSRYSGMCSVTQTPSRTNASQVAIKTMKKTFDSFSSCLELREVIFLRSLPPHPHLVPALDIFLDPYSRRLHIAMEYMDGNLYQLMKARDHKPMDAHSVKSILFQILSGLEHIHDREFFHRDIKPENILVSTSQHNDSSHPFRRYSAMMTPPSTPPVYTIKIADFGLARETHSKLPYTTYVSTRWYRAPEVLLRAGHYSAPVDIWAVGAMAVEIATLKPLFPGGNEVDQVWRVCEIMGSPGGWVNKYGQRVGGGEWKDGVRLAQKLGFSFPKVSMVARNNTVFANLVCRWHRTRWTPYCKRHNGLQVCHNL